MELRNFSPQQMFLTMAANRTPEFSFLGWPGGFAEWKTEVLPRVMETLGDWPCRVAAEPELVAEWTDRGVLKRRYLIQAVQGLSAGVQVNLPEETSGPLPAIQCWHGHGTFGKDPVMGNIGSAEIEECIRTYNYDYGHQMALAGFATFAVDWMGKGDLDDTRKPYFNAGAEGRDWCNLYYLHATMLGMTSLSINLAIGRAAVDYVCSLPEVDASRLGVMGLSGGGTMALWSALVDDRFRAAEIACYSDLWLEFGIRDLNYCGMQVAPGLFKLVDLPDLQGLLAPKPLLVDIGANDSCFRIGGAMACYKQLERIYEAVGAREHLKLDLFPGGHAWGGHLSRDFFKKHLGV